MNRLLKRGILWVMIFPLFLLGSCGGDDEMNPEPSVDAEITFTEESQSYVSGGMTFEAAADSKTVHFTTNQAWDVEVASGEWCTVSPASGSAGSESFTVSVTENTEDADRSTSITLTAGTASQTLQVTQTSASFDVEEVSSYITEVTGVVDELFMQSEGIEDLSQHEDDIRALEGVEAVEVTDLELAVKIKNGGFISWYYPPQQEIAAANNQVNLLQGFSQSVFASTRGLATDHEFIDAKSICIINQTANDEKYAGTTNAFSQLESHLSSLFNVKLIQGEAANLDFFASLTGYDYIFMETHGSYSGGMHWLATGETVVGTSETWLKEHWGSQWRRGSFGIMKLKETRNSKETEVAYWRVNENFIQSLQGSFNRSIIFNTACESLKGTNSLANAFQEKGAGVYIGYDDVNEVGTKAGIELLGYMTRGMTVEQAIDSIPYEYKIDAKCGGNLHYYPQSGGILCILHPEVQTLEATDITGNTAKVHGTITRWSETFDPSNSQAGFCWSSTNPEPTIESGKSKSESVELFQSDGTSISINGNMFDLDPNTTYYYRAFLYMNGDYYYGDVKEVKTTEQEDDGMRAYLVKLYQDTDGDNWTRNDNWLSDKPITEWYGVSSYMGDGKGGYVINLGNNNLQGSADLSNCIQLRALSCVGNNLTSLNVSNCINLSSLSYYDNDLISLDLSGCVSLKYEGSLIITGKNLENLNISGTKTIVRLICDHNKLTNLNVSECENLTTIECNSNNLTFLDVSNCKSLGRLVCSNNNLSTLDLSGLNKLTTLYCENNRLQSLDVSGCSELKSIYCSHNELSSINLSGLQSLWYLYCSDNNLTNIDITGLTSLSTLDCRNNDIISEITKEFAEIRDFHYDKRYSYSREWDPIEEVYVTKYVDNGVGWWYPGEPESGRHGWPDE